MKLSDYMSPAKFPVTSQKDLSPKQQFMIDAFNYDSLIQYQAEGGEMDEEQVKILEELKIKIPAQKTLKAELKSAE